MANSNGGSSRTNLILKAAEDGRYGVIAAIAYNIEQLYGLVKAAEKARSPLILQFFPWAVTYADGLLIRSAAIARDAACVPISIHLDHAQDPAIVKLAADMLPFDSIMVDMSHYEKEENLAKTAALVKYCQERGIATEAEPGRIEGAEDGVMDTAELEACLTTPEEVEEFVGTGVDTLAPAFKNIHGEYGPEGPQLDFERYVAHGTWRFGENWLLILAIQACFNKKPNWGQGSHCAARHKRISKGHFAKVHRARCFQGKREPPCSGRLLRVLAS